MPFVRDALRQGTALAVPQMTEKSRALAPEVSLMEILQQYLAELLNGVAMPQGIVPGFV